ncbi:TolC family protein [Cytophagaceae bacterium DM2B3-1]|uniref:TolC family protein n=2 Tax=Xanthocytophaga TaxID=3078918 RepID=A0ABT7CFB1_9BACT|nr:MULTISPECIES: TolC family protein [Xanthocytophaga]MDJ1492431.1 TolC family protein [Xanthocytophaga flavus]MDJ1499896.1 TolC family protein [Xanthocytophaga agilis]
MNVLKWKKLPDRWLGISLCLFFIQIGVVQAQDTLRISLNQADSIFLNQNLRLLAEKYAIEASKAQLAQTKLWDNPQLSTEWSLYNNLNRKVLDVGSAGQKTFSIQQLVVLAGKRNKRVAMSRENTRMSEFAFYDLLRTLKFELRRSFYHIAFSTQTIERFTNQLAVLDNTISALETQYNKNNISLKDVVRLKAAYYQLNNDKTQLLASIANEHLQLQLLLQTSRPVVPILDESMMQQYDFQKTQSQNLIDLAITNRSDLHIVESQVKQAEMHYRLQKSLAIPDLSIGASYDQAGSYIPHYLALTVGLDLPVFNRNQGNIKMAKSEASMMQLQQQNKQLEVRNEVAASLNKLRQIEDEYKKVDTNFRTQFEQLNTGVLTSFRKQNVSLLEFVDLFEAYNQSIEQLNRLRIARIESFEELNYVVGVELFR